MSNPKTTFINALNRLSAEGIDIIRVSGLWRSPSWPPGLGYPDYLNAVAEISFSGIPTTLLKVLNGLEAEFGRNRAEKNAPRSLDLDILDYNGLIKQDSKLTLPHPRMLDRGFVLFPLQEIAPEWSDPAQNISIENHIAKLPLSDVAPMQYIGKFYDLTKGGHIEASR